MKASAALLLTLASLASGALLPAVQVGDSLQLWVCDPNNGRQAWEVGTGYAPSVVNVRGSDSLCWDRHDGSTSAEAGLRVSGCKDGNAGYRFDTTTDQIVSSSGKCASVTVAAPGYPVILTSCNTSDTLQRFSFDNTTGLISMPAADGSRPLCVDAGSPVNCWTAPLNTYAYCNSSLSPVERAADLAPRLSVADWANLLYHVNKGVPHLGVPAMRFSEGIHGCMSHCLPPYTDPVTGYTSSGCPTSFPHATLMGGSFNRTLWHAVATVISDEGRALHNHLNYDLLIWTPDINPFRDPRWGRGQDVTGEDPTLMSEYVYQYVTGMQEGPDDRCVKLVSTATHFSGFDLEGWKGITAGGFTANISTHDIVSYFWPPFKSATQRGRVQAVMCSYNAISLDGGPSIPTCAWSWANNDVMRGQWGWEGFIVSDCGAISSFGPGQAHHNYSVDMLHATAAGILGGTGVNCGIEYPENIVEAVSQGLLTLNDLVNASSPFLAAGIATGLLDPASECMYNSYGPEMVDTASSRQLAKEAAQQGIALLANNVTSTPWGKAPLLPLNGSALSGKTIAVIGPNANTTQGMLSIFVGANTVVNNQSVLMSISRRAAVDGFNVKYSVGCTWTCSNTSGFDEAAATASSADVVVLVVGLYPGKPVPDGGPRQEDQGADRTNLTLPGFQPELVKFIASVGKPIVLVLIHGGPLALDDTALALPTILDAHYPGEMGGDAVTEILFGDVSPSGRLTTTVYPAEYVSQRNMTDYVLAAHTDAYGQQIPGVTYLYYQGPTQWPFGFGLSYTTFTYSWLSGEELSYRTVDVSDVSALPPYAVNVTNTGSVTSDVSALAFLSTGVVGEPIQQLFDFQRASAVGPGETVTLTFTIPPELMARVSAEGSRVLSPGTKVRVRIGDVPREGWSSWESDGVVSGGSYVSGVLDVVGEGDVVLSSLPPRK